MVLLALVLGPALASCASAVTECRSVERVTIEIVRHRWHTGIIIPRGEIAAPLAFLEERFPEAAYFELGWGDNRFYREPDSNWLIARALFWPTDTVLHVVGLQRPAAELPHGDLLSLSLPRENVFRLQQALASDFRLRDGEPVAVEPGLYGESTFYEAHGNFWFANTCNTWTAERLDHAGVPLRTFMTLTADSVMDQLREAKREHSCLAPASRE